MGGVLAGYQPGVYVPLKALFLVFATQIVQVLFFRNPKFPGWKPGWKPCFSCAMAHF